MPNALQQLVGIMIGRNESAIIRASRQISHCIKTAVDHEKLGMEATAAVAATVARTV